MRIEKKSIVDLFRNIVRMTYTTLIFPKGVLKTNEHCKCEGQKQ